MNTLFVHIGLPKTGTKSLQRCLQSSQEDLLKNNIYYPIDNITQHNTNCSHDGFFRNFDNVYEIIKTKLNFHDIIISSESISGWVSHSSENEVNKKIEKLKNLNSKIIFIITTRDFESWSCSFIKQTIRVIGVQNTNQQTWLYLLNKYIESVNKLINILKRQNIPIYFIRSNAENPNFLIIEFEKFLNSKTDKNITDILQDNYKNIGKINITSKQNFFTYVISPYLRVLYTEKHKLYRHDKKVHPFIKQFKNLIEIKNDETLNMLFNEYLDDFVNNIQKALIIEHADNVQKFKNNLNI